MCKLGVENESRSRRPDDVSQLRRGRAVRQFYYGRSFQKGDGDLVLDNKMEFTCSSPLLVSKQDSGQSDLGLPLLSAGVFDSTTKHGSFLANRSMLVCEQPLKILKISNRHDLFSAQFESQIGDNYSVCANTGCIVKIN